MLQPVSKPTASRIAPVSAALVAARRDPRLAHRAVPTPAPTVAPMPTPTPVVPVPPIAGNVFDIKPLDRVTKRKNVITIDVRPDGQRDPRRRDPRVEKRQDDRPARREKPRKDRQLDRKKAEDERERKRRIDIESNKKEEKAQAEKADNFIDKLFDIPDAKKINKLPPIPKINRDEAKDKAPSPVKRRKEVARIEKKKKRDNNVDSPSKDSSSGSSPEKRIKSKEAGRKAKAKERAMEVEEKPAEDEVVAFKELKNYHKERYMRRNKEKSESPEVTTDKVDEEKPAPKIESSSKISLYVNECVARAIEIIIKNILVDVCDTRCKRRRKDNTCCVEIKYFITLGVFILTCFMPAFVPLLLRSNSQSNVINFSN